MLDRLSHADLFCLLHRHWRPARLGQLQQVLPQLRQVSVKHRDLKVTQNVVSITVHCSAFLSVEKNTMMKSKQGQVKLCTDLQSKITQPKLKIPLTSRFCYMTLFFTNHLIKTSINTKKKPSLVIDSFSENRNLYITILQSLDNRY